MNNQVQKQREDQSSNMIWKFDRVYDRQPVVKWFEFDDG